MANKSLNSLVPATTDWAIADPPDPQLDTTNERRTARLSKSKQWKQASEYIDGRIHAYQQYLPGVNPAIRGSEADWAVADCVTKELIALKNYVETIGNGVS